MALMSFAALGSLRGAAPAPADRPQSGLVTFLTGQDSIAFRRFLGFSALIHATTLLADPYFAVDLLQHLHFSSLEYDAWLATQTVGQRVSL